MKSEYDYNSKKKFVDVLSHSSKKPNGLKGLEVGQKPGDGSLRSYRSGKYSTTSSLGRKNISVKGGTEIEAIPEADELTVIDRDGNKIRLNPD